MKKVEQPVKRIQQESHEDLNLCKWCHFPVGKTCSYLPNPYRYNVRGSSPNLLSGRLLLKRRDNLMRLRKRSPAWSKF
jgi:hypothetical protein